MGHILSLLTYLLTTSVSGRVPGYPSYYPAGTRVINYPDTAALLIGRYDIVTMLPVDDTKMSSHGTSQ